MNLDNDTAKYLGISDKVIKRRNKLMGKTPEGSSYGVSFWLKFYFIEIFYFNFTAILLSLAFNLDLKFSLISIGASFVLYWVIYGKKSILTFLANLEESKYEKERLGVKE